MEATIASLIDSGCAGTTTRRVAERSGLSQGAVQHYFPTRVALLEAAVRRIADQTAQAAIQRAAGFGGSGRQRVCALIDTAWDLAHTPPVIAAVELVAAARTDTELTGAMAQLVEYAHAAVLLVARAVVGETADLHGSFDWLRVTLLTIYGATLASSVAATSVLVPDWAIIRSHLIASFDTWASQNQPLASP
ncbi:hypothetical protein BKG83_15955 [Mycobacteroides chelonae]|nr:hypothetical protein BKG83_15955 [Mycobacteroides chelonae]